jgi:hypothetical protein
LWLPLGFSLQFEDTDKALLSKAVEANERTPENGKANVSLTCEKNILLLKIEGKHEKCVGRIRSS